MAGLGDDERISKLIDEVFDDEGDGSELEDDVEKVFDSDDTDADPDFCPDDENDAPDFLERILEIERRQNEVNKGQKRKRGSKGSSSSSKSSQEQVSQPRSAQPYTIIEIPNKTELTGKNGYVWKTKPDSLQNKTKSKNIIHIRPGPKTNIDPDVEECFKLFITEDIMEEILLCTNKEIQTQRQKYALVSATLRDTCKEELNALIGLLILSATLKDNHLSAKLLFNSEYCGDRYRATMSRERFIFLINCLKFDDRETREERRVHSKLAAIKHIWDLFISNCTKNYKPSSYCTIDEQLVGFRGRCPFRVYMSNKPNKYGIKIFMVCDNASKYMYKAIVYLGKQTSSVSVPIAQSIVEELVVDMKGSNRNITMDNWFMSVPLVKKLKDEYNMTTVGTVRKNKRELPSEFTELKFENRDVNSSLFLFSEDITAVSFKPNTRKLVTLLSSMHDDANVDPLTKKPEIILTYNQTKGAVDTLDQMCQNTNSGRKTRRWPLCLFYNILNIAMINSYVVFCHQFFKRNPENLTISTRQEFLLELQKKLTRPWQIIRCSVPTLSKELRSKIETISEMPRQEAAPNQIVIKGERKYCSMCSYKKKRFTTTYCAKCKKPVCGEHKKKLCPTC